MNDINFVGQLFQLYSFYSRDFTKIKRDESCFDDLHGLLTLKGTDTCIYSTLYILFEKIS